MRSVRTSCVLACALRTSMRTSSRVPLLDIPGGCIRPSAETKGYHHRLAAIVSIACRRLDACNRDGIVEVMNLAVTIRCCCSGMCQILFLPAGQSINVHWHSGAAPSRKDLHRSFVSVFGLFTLGLVVLTELGTV